MLSRFSSGILYVSSSGMIPVVYMLPTSLIFWSAPFEIKRNPGERQLVLPSFVTCGCVEEIEIGFVPRVAEIDAVFFGVYVLQERVHRVANAEF